MTDREYWIGMLCRVSWPVLISVVDGTIATTLPIVNEEHRKSAPLEAVGRTLAGIAPWLEKSEDTPDHKTTLELAQACLDKGTDPTSPSYLRFGETAQSLVDTAFLALAILRAPTQLWYALPSDVQQNMRKGFELVLSIKPSDSNWVLFSAIVEAALNFMYADKRYHARIDYALYRFDEWYLGDGIYGDGPNFAFDYYNSIVIHPFLTAILSHIGLYPRIVFEHFRNQHMIRSIRYAQILERMIAPDGSFPPLGRSLGYRCGVFHHLAAMAYESFGVPPGQLRTALTAVLKRTLDAKDTVDNKGWLQVGLAGHQSNLAEEYISTGSLYACALIFLPLGISENADFWTAAAQDSTSRQIWSGINVEADHSLKE